MRLALQYSAASLAGNCDLQEALQALPSAAVKVSQDLPIIMREFMSRHFFSDYVCLAQGPCCGQACESSLKMELSRFLCAAFPHAEISARLDPDRPRNLSRAVLLKGGKGSIPNMPQFDAGHARAQAKAQIAHI
jgi:hypothetical protein